MTVRVFICFFIICWIFGCTNNQKNEQLLKKKQKQEETFNRDSLNTRLMAATKECGLMGLSVLIMKEGKTKYRFNYGFANYESKKQITDSTAYRIASISKVISSTALLILYDNEKFALDDDISEFLGYKIRNPHYPDIPITFEMLLTHTSTISGGHAYLVFSDSTVHSKNPPNIKSLLLPDGKYYSDEVYLKKKPGTYFTYSNLAFGLIATLIEKISGERFDIFCRKNIFEPLGMTASFNIHTFQKPENIAVLYNKPDTVWIPKIDDLSKDKFLLPKCTNYKNATNGLLYAPQGGLRVSPVFLLKFMQMLTNKGAYNGNNILKPETVKMMLSPQYTIKTKDDGDTYGGLFYCWGLGVQIITNHQKGDIIFPDNKLVGHAGQAYGLISGMYFSPVKQSGFVFMTNGRTGKYKIGEKSAYYVLEEKIFDAVNLFGGISQ